MILKNFNIFIIFIIALINIFYYNYHLELITNDLSYIKLRASAFPNNQDELDGYLCRNSEKIQLVTEKMHSLKQEKKLLEEKISELLGGGIFTECMKRIEELIKKSYNLGVEISKLEVKLELLLAQRDINVRRSMTGFE